VTNKFVFIHCNVNIACHADKGQLGHSATETAYTFLWTSLSIFSW